MAPDANTFAATWEAGWNSHDLDRILAHYRDEIVFRSRKAIPLMGTGLISGKPALRQYWTYALERQPTLSFRIQDVFSGHEMIAITYRNHKDVLAVETLHFDDHGLVYQASACHKA